ncbi:MAG: tetratricopeptide repeat protein [Alphaproteobacteria bacterium]|nr:tetratricopeptide repeat protein [Alphaproteobacteria bacterium]
MLRDRYGLVLSTGSMAARDAYVEAMDLFLGANTGAEQGFARAALEDPSFALAHAGQARALQMRGRGREAADAMGAARAAADGCSAREAGHLNALGLLIDGDGPGAYAAILAHLGEWPLDAMIAQPCCGVFGLIGFSGRSGREAEQLAFTDRLAPHYGNDWWFLAQHGFSQVEAGQVAEAERLLERALAGNPRNANAAHIRAHVHYEAGEFREGLVRLDSWRRDYDREAQLSCHIAWHVAIWRAAAGDMDEAWRVFEADVAPGGAWGPPINVLTDSAAFVLRAELAGRAAPDGTWERLSDYAGEFFPNPGIAFADIHAALAHAMAGRGNALMRIVEAAAGPAGDMVSGLAEALGAYARSDWEGAVSRLAPWMATHERIGGSRAQRDLLEFALLGALLRSGRTEEARRLLVLRRPVHAPAPPLAALRMAA